MKPLKARRFTAEDLDQFRPKCLKCGETMQLDDQSQGYMHNACVAYPPGEREVAFRAEQERRAAFLQARRLREAENAPATEA